MRSRNSIAILLLAESSMLYWKFHIRLSPHTGSLPYCPGDVLVGPLNHGSSETGSSTLMTILEIPQTLLILSSSSITTENPAACENPVGNTPLRIKMFLCLSPNSNLRLVESSESLSNLLLKCWYRCD